MKKTLSLLAAIIICMMQSNAQDFKVGVRFNPLNSYYTVHSLLGFNRTTMNYSKSADRFDSLTMGIFCEKYFAKKAFLIRVDINYADMNTFVNDTSTTVSTYQNTGNNQTDKLSQKFININLGIGTHVTWNKFIFTFGVYVPLTILPKGKVEGTDKNYSYGQLTNDTKYTGTYKPTLGFGIGAFGGVNIIILKHLSLGIDVAYHIEYLQRKLNQHNETHYYGTNAYMTYNDTSDNVRNYFTSKITPSIVIAYAFDVKKKEK